MTCKAPGLGGATESGLRATARACAAQHHLRPHGRIHLSGHPHPFSSPSHLPSQGTFIPSSVIICSFPEPHLAFLVTNITVQLQKSCTLRILRGVCVSSGSATALGPLSVKILVRDSPGALRNLGPQPTLSRNLPLQMT